MKTRKLSRSTAIKLAAAAGVAVVAGEALITVAPWQNEEQALKRVWETPFQAHALRELVRYATLAPSGHNAQPWTFTLSESRIQIAPDYSRRLPSVDPHDRELWISLGCALENLVIAARYGGYETDVGYPTVAADWITVALKPASGQRASLLFDAIPHRQNTRRLYDGRPVSTEEARLLETVTAGERVSLRLLTETRQKEALLESVTAGNLRQFGDRAFLDELTSWVRFNKPEALRTLDGLSSRCTGNPQVPRWLGRRFLTARGAARQSATDAENLRSSSGVIVIASQKDDKRHWIETGRLYERLALTATRLGLKTAFLNQPVEVVELRSQLQSHLALGTAYPQLLLRFGHAPAMPRSLRRPPEEVLR